MSKLENQANTMASDSKLHEYGLKAARRAPQFSKRRSKQTKKTDSSSEQSVFCFGGHLRTGPAIL